MTTYRALETISASVTTGTVVSISDFGFDADNMTQARRALVSTITNNAMVTQDGTDPTSTLGHSIAAVAAGRPPTHMLVAGPDFSRIKLLGLGGTATVTITIFR